MSDTELNVGRPYGGVAILWKSSLNVKVQPVCTDSSRLCAVLVEMCAMSFLLCSVYMPCDTCDDYRNLREYNDVLDEIVSLTHAHNVSRVIIGGDFNTDLCRANSLHTHALNAFSADQDFRVLGTNGPHLHDVPFTYESHMNQSRSTIDHFVLTENIVPDVLSVRIECSVDNMSDHLPVTLYVSVAVEHVHDDPRPSPPRPQWHLVTDEVVVAYRSELDAQLDNLVPPTEALHCTDPRCEEHYDQIVRFHDGLVSACLNAGQRCIPSSAERAHDARKRTPGWNEYIAPLRDDALFWHFLWKECGRPARGAVADIRRRTRTKYHGLLKRLRKNENNLRYVLMAQKFHQQSRNNFWTEVKKMKGGKGASPRTVDGEKGDERISDVFYDKYKALYNSVGFEDEAMRAIENEVEREIHCHSETSCHVFRVDEIISMSKELKRGKHDGNLGLYSDHIIIASERFFSSLTLLFNCMLSHCVVPQGLQLCTIVPIPKSAKKSVNDSDNYRAIALSSVLGKVLDKVILMKSRAAFTTSMYQFGYKRLHSTVQCEFVVNEIIEHYMEGNSTVYVALLDATKAFDRVEYPTLFRTLRCKNICPVLCLFLIRLYLSQKIRVRWGSHCSEEAHVSNGVKQGGVLSPLLFTVYIDVLLNDLASAGLGCHIGNVYCGSLGYADDIVLLSPSLCSLNSQLSVCSDFAERYKVQFNPLKTKMLVLGKDRLPLSPLVTFMGKQIEIVNVDKHLGCVLGNVSNRDKICPFIRDFIVRVNSLKCHFKNAPVDVTCHLFHTFCMPLYSSTLWDLSHPSIGEFYTTWRKCIRSLFHLPYRTHSRLLPGLCNDLPINAQMFLRFFNFFKSVQSSSNPITFLCSQLALNGSRSSVSNNVISLSSILNCNNLHLCSYSIDTVRENLSMFSSPECDSVLGSLLRDLINIRNDTILFGENHVNACLNSINFAITAICTE
jgi:hypothetical protein